MPKNEDDKLLTVEDIQALRAEISLMHTALASDLVGHSPLIKKVIKAFMERGLKQEWLEKLLAPLVGTEIDDDEVMLVAYILEELDLLLSIKEEEVDVEKTVHIVVGGTGIGKTSLLGKLAARYTYFLKKSHHCVFLNFDRDKVGAVEQLENYAEAMDIPLIGIEDFFDNEYDIVFVDTAGSRGSNLEDLEKFIAFIKEEMHYRVKISLALSATSKMRDLEGIVKAFEVFTIDDFILTKLDETCDLSDIINFLIMQKKPISYISTGQEIPEDLIVASKEYLLNQFMKDNS